MILHKMHVLENPYERWVVIELNHHHVILTTDCQKQSGENLKLD